MKTYSEACKCLNKTVTFSFNSSHFLKLQSESVGTTLLIHVSTVVKHKLEKDKNKLKNMSKQI